MSSLPPKIGTGVAGLDEVLQGGFQSGRVYLLEGTPGAGKTTLALQFLLAGAEIGESGLYLNLSESTDELHAVAASHGWSLAGIHVHEAIGDDDLDPDQDQSVLHPFEVEFGETIDAMLSEVEAKRPARIVFDSLSEMRLLIQSPLRYRRQILALKRFITQFGCTALLLDDSAASRNDLQLHSIVHGVIMLDQQAADYGAERRRLRVTKMRGSTFCEGWHDYAIRTGGVVVFPRIVTEMRQPTILDRLVSSGAEGLDALLGGGLVRGTNTLLMGPSGAGKSSTATAAVVAAAKRGESVAFFVFDETLSTLVTRSVELGMDLRPHMQSGVLQLHQVDPVGMSPGQFANVVAQSVCDDGARVVVIDSLNAYLQAVPSERYLMLQMHELLAHLNSRGIVTLIVLGQHGLLGDVRADIELSYLADVVVLLRFFEVHGSVRKAISVLKTRTTAHEPTIRELILGPKGLHVGEPLRNFRGLLSGIPDWFDAAAEQPAAARADGD